MLHILPISGKYSCQPRYGPHDLLLMMCVDGVEFEGHDDDDDDEDGVDDEDDDISNETVICRGPLLCLLLWNRLRALKNEFDVLRRLFVLLPAE